MARPVTPEKLLSSGILEKWHSKTFADFTNDDKAAKKVKNYMSKLDSAYTDGVGLYLWGANGTGKSLIMATSFMKMMPKYQVHIISLSTLITKFTGSWYSEVERQELYDILTRAHFLGIEEIGKEFHSSNNLGATVLDSIIRYRIQRKLPVWVTSNVAPDQITSSYTEDIASMLREAVIPVQVTGRDMRKDIADTIAKKYL